MNISNAITAPILLVVILVVTILFQSVFMKSPSVVMDYSVDSSEDADPEFQTITIYETEDGESINAGTNASTNTEFIIYNGVKYYPDRFLLLIIIAYICSCLLPSVFYVKLKGIDWFRSLKLTLPNMRLIPFAIYMFFVLIIGAVLLNYLFFHLTGEMFVFPNIDAGSSVVFNIGVFLSFILVPAVCEEFVFRSVLMAEYERYGVIWSLMITSVSFAMSRFSIQLFAVYFFASVVLFICAKVTGSLIIPVVLHTVYSFFNIYIENRFMNVLKFEQNRFIFLFVLSILFIVFICLSLSSLEELYYRKAYRNDPSPVNIHGNMNAMSNLTNFARTFLSPSFIAATVIFFIYVSILS